MPGACFLAPGPLFTELLAFLWGEHTGKIIHLQLKRLVLELGEEKARTKAEIGPLMHVAWEKAAWGSQWLLTACVTHGSYSDNQVFFTPGCQYTLSDLSEISSEAILDTASYLLSSFMCSFLK